MRLSVIRITDLQPPYERTQAGMFGIGSATRLDLSTRSVDRSLPLLWQLEGFGIIGKRSWLQPVEFTSELGQRTRSRAAAAAFVGSRVGVGGADATLGSRLAELTRTGPPSVRIDRSPRIACSEPSIGTQGSSAALAPSGAGTRYWVTSIHSPSLTPVRISVRIAWLFWCL